MQSKSGFHIVLVAPEIPGNTGSIGRTCLALETPLHLIHPLAFDLSEKAVRRAGLDYWKDVDVYQYENWQDFLKKNCPEDDSLFLLSRFATKTLYQQSITKNSYFIFGSETQGLSEQLKAPYQDRLFKLPILSNKVRSLNLACCATAVAYEAHRQLS